MSNTAPLDKLFPCKCHVSTHGSSYDGICHGIGVTKCGRPYAIVENSNGDISLRRLDAEYSVQLIREKT
jgi:hypothetical protein